MCGGDDEGAGCGRMCGGTCGFANSSGACAIPSIVCLSSTLIHHPSLSLLCLLFCNNQVQNFLFPSPTRIVYTLLFTCCDSTHTPSVNNGPLITVLSLLLSCNQVQNFPFPSPPEPSALKAAHACLEALSALNPGGCERCGDGCVPGVGVRSMWVVGVAGVCGWCSGA